MKNKFTINDVFIWLVLILMILNCVALAHLNKFDKLQVEFDRHVVEILSELANEVNNE